MKRDWDCIRAILLALEDKGDTASPLGPNEVKGFDQSLVSYYIRRLMEAGLVKGTCAGGSAFCIATEMTWQGHEHLDKVRSTTVWNKIKSATRERAIPLSFDAIRILAVDILKKAYPSASGNAISGGGARRSVLMNKSGT